MTDINSSNFMYQQGDSGAGKRKPSKPRTEGGYLINDYRSTGTSDTGYWRQSPRGNVPITRKEFKQDAVEKSPYTYRNYQVPMFEGSELVGLPSGASITRDGMTHGLWGLRNTQTDLNRVLSFKSNRVREIQTQLYRYGWISKNSITGSAETESFQGAIAFLMYKGNRVGYNWQDLIPMGPQGLPDGTRAPGGGGGGPQYGVPSTSTQTQINHATKGDARAFLKQALADILGRGPEPGEFNEFLDTLREKEENNPSVTTTTSVINSATDDETSSETEGGMTSADYQRVAERYARSEDPEQAKRYKRAFYEQTLDELIASQ